MKYIYSRTKTTRFAHIGSRQKDHFLILNSLIKTNSISGDWHGRIKIFYLLQGTLKTSLGIKKFSCIDLAKSLDRSRFSLPVVQMSSSTFFWLFWDCFRDFSSFSILFRVGSKDQFTSFRPSSTLDKDEWVEVKPCFSQLLHRKATSFFQPE